MGDQDEQELHVIPLHNPLKDRLTVVSRAYHQRVGKEPKMVNSAFSRTLESHQQLYQRELEATEEWELLDCGWVESAGMLIIQNVEGQGLQRNPTEEEKEASAKKVLQLSYAVIDGSYWLIPPGESIQAFPSKVTLLYIRSQSGITEYTLTIFPR
ncbi:hypothetical protein LCGC14_0908990 [marine sediment metagenome]|uniref:Uncharacterized protein n=1 Tax=marine sediment metagenome TaxID=412755 RepID=A0A0F9S0Y9_9ZZZZ